MEESEVEIKNRSRKNKIRWMVGIFFVLLLIGFSGGTGYKFVQSKFGELQAREDSIIKQSQIIQDSLVISAKTANENALQWQAAAQKLELENYKQYETIRKKEQLLRNRNNRDTSFVNNARFIAKSVDRYYKEKDSIK